MNNNGHTIKIKQRKRRTTEQIIAAIWEVRLVHRIRQLTAAGDGEFIVRKRGDEITICRIGKPEVVKE